MSKSSTEVITNIKKMLEKKSEILAGYLYGSHSKGYATNLSDYDVALTFKPNNKPENLYKYMFDLNNEVETSLKDIKVEIIPADLMSYPLKYKSVLFGKNIYSADESTRVREEIKIQNNYEDIKGLYDLRYTNLIKDAKERLYG